MYVFPFAACSHKPLEIRIVTSKPLAALLNYYCTAVLNAQCLHDNGKFPQV